MEQFKAGTLLDVEWCSPGRLVRWIAQIPMCVSFFIDERFVLFHGVSRMKRTSKKKDIKAVPVSAEKPAIQVAGEREVTFARPPSVGELLAEAAEEPNFIDLDEYLPVIEQLREKGFSYREVANWLTARGIEVSYGAVYRLCVRRLAYDEAVIAEQELQEEEDAETHRAGF